MKSGRTRARYTKRFALSHPGSLRHDRTIGARMRLPLVLIWLVEDIRCVDGLRVVIHSLRSPVPIAFLKPESVRKSSSKLPAEMSLPRCMTMI